MIIKEAIVNIIGIRVSKKIYSRKNNSLASCDIRQEIGLVDSWIGPTDVICLGCRKIASINTGCRLPVFCIASSFTMIFQWLRL